jgi:hypothetical protein
MTSPYPDDIHQAILLGYTDPYERIGAAVVALALKDSIGEHPRLAQSARKWIRNRGKTWIEALGLEPQYLKELIDGN